ncbi:Crp/Fnr family transcriptional regulator [Amorphus orientalis]|uniref:CRP-like cAMP-binding protein n=1 Tax=Amorphus orientalis TaxID=649198 RepID=A0AAE3VSQ7_9HYPH|nr:Crp/Fnr family transcriptional regulator [Amorphus orientalis]MDQ0317468.1 CRP-like cAMP-binding protein [Amorphus orientalis]
MPPADPHSNPLVRKLDNFARLSFEERRILHHAATERVRRIGARESLVHEGGKPPDISLLLSGWACRYKMLSDGRRQILAFLIPGDLFEQNGHVLREMDHSIGTLTPVEVGEIARPRFDEVLSERPRIAQGLLWDTLVGAAIQREWTVNLGRRDAPERVGHLLCELFVRLQSVGLTLGNRCDLPLTQNELADATGMSTVHVNRTIQDLRAANLIILREKTLTIPDMDTLKRATRFSPTYLHLQRVGGHLDASD